MVDHVRTQIRKAVIAEVTGLTTTGANVFDSRVWNFEDSELPALSVSTPDDELDAESEGQGLSQVRHCTVTVEGRVKKTADYAAKLDNIDKEVTEALAESTEVDGATVLAGLIVTFEWRSWAMTISSEQDKPLLLGVSTFLATYQVNASDLESVA